MGSNTDSQSQGFQMAVDALSDEDSLAGSLSDDSNDGQLGAGLDMLVSGKTIVEDKIKTLAEKGVVFNACEFSIKERKVDRSKIISVSGFVPAGILEIVGKQGSTELRRAASVAKQIYGREELDQYGDTNALDVLRRLLQRESREDVALVVREIIGGMAKFTADAALAATHVEERAPG